jgi:hypothetical protein
MNDPLTLALGEDALSDLHAELDELRAEVKAHRDLVGHLAEDLPHAGQPVHVEYRYTDGEPIYRLQVTHADHLLWQCNRCRKLTLGDEPACVGCGLNAIEAFEPLLYPQPVQCRTVESAGVSPYDGPCLIAGSDGCDCKEATS